MTDGMRRTLRAVAQAEKTGCRDGYWLGRDKMRAAAALARQRLIERAYAGGYYRLTPAGREAVAAMDRARAEWVEGLRAQTVPVRADMLYALLLMASRAMLHGAPTEEHRTVFRALRDQFVQQCGEEPQ